MSTSGLAQWGPAGQPRLPRHQAEPRRSSRPCSAPSRSTTTTSTRAPALAEGDGDVHDVLRTNVARNVRGLVGTNVARTGEPATPVATRPRPRRSCWRTGTPSPRLQREGCRPGGRPGAAEPGHDAGPGRRADGQLPVARHDSGLTRTGPARPSSARRHVGHRPDRRHPAAGGCPVPRLRGGARPGDGRGPAVWAPRSARTTCTRVRRGPGRHQRRQRPEIQLTRTQFYESKSHLSFTPTGPYLTLVDRDELRRLSSLRLRLSVNGEVRRDSSVAEMIVRPARRFDPPGRFQQLAPATCSPGRPAAPR